MTPLTNLAELDSLRKAYRASRGASTTSIIVCGGPGCQASSCRDVADALNRIVAQNRSQDSSIELKVTGCLGFCEQGPLVMVEPAGTLYCQVKPTDSADIYSAAAGQTAPVERLLYKNAATGEIIERAADIPFYRGQDRQLMSLMAKINQGSIEDYISEGGYSAISKVLSEGIKPETIIAEIKTAGLRGRGGGGFPTARKWAESADAVSAEKYVICNADEGDPGAYMDRGVLEGMPYLVIEGMMIGARTIGANKGYIYVRNEYPVAVKHSKLAIEQARKFGLLGDNIMGTGFSFDIEVARGGGAFVCGESTALMTSIEGKVGEPRAKDVHTAVEGLYHKPTVLNNVETWANVPSIILNGGIWFASKGTKNSKGTKILALTGHIRNTGLVEVAMGKTLTDVIYGIGGGALEGRSIKAVQTGGPSGGCLPAAKFDLPVDFDSLTEAGSMMGSGGMVVMDDTTCLVDVAKYFLTFLQDESCGKCFPCRTGVDRMLEIVTAITEGRGKPEHLSLLEELGETISLTSLCGLGKSAPNPVLSTLRYFREEYEHHIIDKKCPAGVCKSLISYSIDTNKCNGCGVCLKSCAYGAISGRKKALHIINSALCQKCGICRNDCKFDAVLVG